MTRKETDAIMGMGWEYCDALITVTQKEIDGEALFEARLICLPDLVEYGETFEEAYDLAVDAMETTAEVEAEKEAEIKCADFHTH